MATLEKDDATPSKRSFGKDRLNCVMEEIRGVIAGIGDSDKTATEMLIEDVENKSTIISSLHDDISKIKQDKAAIRCDLLKTRKELTATERELSFLKRTYEEASKIEGQLRAELSIEKKLRDQAMRDIEHLKEKENELRKQLEVISLGNKSDAEKLKAEAKMAKDSFEEMKKFYCKQDEIIGNLAEQLKSTEAQMNQREAKWKAHLTEAIEKLEAKNEEILKLKSMEEERNIREAEWKSRLTEAIQKLDSKNEEITKLKSLEEQMSKELQRAYDQMADLEDKLHDMQQESQKNAEGLLYWKRMYERRNSSSDADSESVYSTEAEVVHVEENCTPAKRIRFEDKRTLLKSDIQEQPSTPRMGLMRHEIAHRFKYVWMPLKEKSAVCSFCSEHLSALATAVQCRDCRFFAHISCSKRMGKTCGLPALYADYYVNAINQEAQMMQNNDFMESNY
ncbi:hypothetical protein M3Y98_00830100 [Aphelenchoides besseyi]|nr:hypothetical protein M3Y98_00830100 [Aphelenchoides besseyi]KAI6195413.1 hypothetical protein M3Y96_01228600 [Aphelenchoides besseyi]